MGPLDRPGPDAAVLHALEERGLVFELMTHPDLLRAAATSLEGFDGLGISSWSTPDGHAPTPVTSAPCGSTASTLAELGANVACKLSGLAMPFRSMGADALAPWLEYAIEAFGVDRCMFASNFPVDSMYGTFDELYATFSTVTPDSTTSREKLFAANASASSAADHFALKVWRTTGPGSTAQGPETSSERKRLHPSGHHHRPRSRLDGQPPAAGAHDWVHLRVCQSCGHVGCCDNSPRRHATAHFHGSDHPVIRSYEPDSRGLVLALRGRARLRARGQAPCALRHP